MKVAPLSSAWSDAAARRVVEARTDTTTTTTTPTVEPAPSVPAAPADPEQQVLTPVPARGDVHEVPADVPAPARQAVSPPAPASPITPAHVVWLALVPVALVAVAACALVSEVAGSVLPRPTWTPFPTLQALGWIRPEPNDQARYLVSLMAPVLLVALAWPIWKQVSGLPARRRLDIVVMAVQVFGLGLLAVCWVVQRRYHHWFSERSLLVSLGAVGLLLVAAWRTDLFVVSERKRRGRVSTGLALGAAVALSGLWLLPSVFHDSNLADADEMVRYHLQFTYDDFLSVLNGRTPLVDMAPVYSRLLPFVAEPAFRLFGATLGTFTWTMWALSLLAVVSVYLMFRVVTRDPLAALVLFVPFLAVSMFALIEAGDERVFLANLYGVVPLRVLGPFVLAWLCARQLRAPRRGGPIALFCLAGLVVLANPEFGVPCFLAVLAALWFGHDAPSDGLRVARKYATQALAGGLASVAIVSLFVFARSSSLPRIEYLNHFQRVFAVEGFGMVPMPLLGFHVVVYLTFLAALMGAVAMKLRPPEHHDWVLTGMLAYSGVLGLGALSYWVGRSDELSLFGMFPTWGLAVPLLAWWVLTSVARRPAGPGTARLWAIPSFAVLVAFGLMASVLSQFPSPTSQVRRVAGNADPRPDGVPDALFRPTSTFDRSAAISFVADNTSPGEHVGILASLGHGVAERSGVVNVSPFALQDSIGFDEQMVFALEAIEGSGGRKVFLGPSYPEIPAFLERHGYAVTAKSPEAALTLYSRTR